MKNDKNIIGLCYDGKNYCVNTQYVKNLFNIKSDKKLGELLEYSGIKNPNQTIEMNKIMPKDLSLIAEFVGGDKAEKINHMIDTISEYENNTSITQKDYDKQKRKMLKSCEIIKVPPRPMRKEDIHLRAKSGFSFAIPSPDMLSFASQKSNGVNFYMNNMRYCVYACQAIISNNSTLSYALEISEELSDIFYANLVQTILNDMDEDEKERMKKENIPLDLKVYNALADVRENILNDICTKDMISRVNIPTKFNHILNNAFMLCSCHRLYFKAMYKAFCEIQYNFITGKYTR